MSSEPDSSHELVCMEDPQEVFAEVKTIVRLIFPQFDFTRLDKVFDDMLLLFGGDYPGYRACNTYYHDLKHTTNCLLVMTRLIHGAVLNGVAFAEKSVFLGLVSALMHDTGYLQAVDDHHGTGGKYTVIHIERSIDFMKQYFEANGYSPEDFSFCRNCLDCTGIVVNLAEIPFHSYENELMGKMLGTADLLGQMGDRTYMERLPFLYHEYEEAGIRGFADELDLLRKTPGFWEFTNHRFSTELGQVDRYLKDHFRVRWGIDRDLDREAVEKNLKYLRHILENPEKDYRQFLKRGSFMDILRRFSK